MTSLASASRPLGRRLVLVRRATLCWRRSNGCQGRQLRASQPDASPHQGWRQSGLTYELAAATVEYGKQVGARVLEGYAIEAPPGKTVIWDEASVGPVQVFLEAG